MFNLSKTCSKLSIPLLVFFTICFWASPAQAKYGGGTGEPNDPYLIFDANQMNAIGADSNDWNKHFILMADIDLSAYTGTSFNIIGTAANPFTGVFDGSGHEILNFTYESNGINNIGLFGYVDDYGYIGNLCLVDPNVDGGTGIRVGAIVGYQYKGIISRCYTHGGSISGKDCVGGIAGLVRIGQVNHSYSTAHVSGEIYVGGIVGFLDFGAIQHSYSSGNISGVNRVGGLAGSNFLNTLNCYSTARVSAQQYAGGLIGEQYRGIIKNSYSLGIVFGDNKVGGLVGSMYGNASIEKSYSATLVSGSTKVGGLIGNLTSATVVNSFWDTQASGQSTSDGGIGKSTAEMMRKSTFTDAGWDFDQIWDIDPVCGPYPYLWRHPPGDINHDDIVNMYDFAILADHWLAGL